MEVSQNIASVTEPVGVRLHRIADLLFINASFCKNYGLLHGKMGIAVFLYQYARNTGFEIYESYAGDLIDEVYAGINIQTPVGFAEGLTGIGWSIEYLARNGFVDADTDEALAEIDDAVYRSLIKDPLLKEGCHSLFGYGLYYLSRSQGEVDNSYNKKALQIKECLVFIIGELEKLLVRRQSLIINNLSRSVAELNSFAWFLLEMKKTGLVTEKVDKIIFRLLKDIEIILKDSYDRAGKFMLWNIMQNMIPHITDLRLQQKWHSILTDTVDKMEFHYDEEHFVNDFISIVWQKLIYSPLALADNFINQMAVKVFNIIDDYDKWVKRVDNLNLENIGLAGLAGLGLGLMNYAEGYYDKY